MKYETLYNLEVNQSLEIETPNPNPIRAALSVHGKKKDKKYKTSFSEGKLTVTRVS